MTVVDIRSRAKALVANVENIPFETDAGVGTLGNIGLLVLRTDQTIEDEFRFAIPNDVGLYGARLPSPVEITPENLLKMEVDIPRAAGLLPDVTFGAIGFGCTSGALVIGEGTVAERVREVLPGVQVTDPVTAAIAAFSALGVRRIALLTPYIASINHTLRDAFMARGLEVPVMGSFNEPDDNLVARITPKSIEEAIMQIGRSEQCEAVFVSCTSLRVARIAEEIEAKLNKPITSSNHAMAWHLLRLSGYENPIPNLGTLYRATLKELV